MFLSIIYMTQKALYYTYCFLKTKNTYYVFNNFNRHNLLSRVRKTIIVLNIVLVLWRPLHDRSLNYYNFILFNKIIKIIFNVFYITLNVIDMLYFIRFKFNLA